MKALFLTKYPIEGASSRYRVYQYLPELERLGVHATVSPFMNSRMYRLTFSPGHRLGKALQLLRACGRRLAALWHWRQYDVIVMQRELFPFGPIWLERLLKRRGACLVFDYDDALFIPKPGKFDPAVSRLRSSERIFTIMAQCRCVIAGNDYLRDVARAHCPRAEVLHVAEDTSRFGKRESKPQDAPLVIGWLGSPTTEKYLRLIAPVLDDILAEYPQCSLRIVGGGDFDLPGHRVEHVPWSLDREVAELENFDIGIMPLPLEEWSLGKSGGKARTYMAAALPVICTAIGYNRELIEDGVNGYLVESPDEWRQALRRLLSDGALRQTVGCRAQQHVATHFSPAGQAAQLASILRELELAA